ncbi:type IVB secretion system protein IcmH/DotU [Massilia endophytica]|uniref:type IVB secretion system protein IcmH/DotU n=1 Tax=Massilia endophytica TaxID=2899220 RepID=UPI001E336FAA|nr:type IVB secretion system protein IcmH/DotU [Massilia endophytica]UGQ44834.1 type IVB secretion system protein IcmH/DotU [Massilia endophytica]
MNAHIERRAAPTLFGTAPAAAGGVRVQSLVDLMQQGFHLLFLLKNGSAPPGEAEFAARVMEFLDGFDREARALYAHGEDIEAAKYAWCAALDEIILSSDAPLREAWERKPLQLTVFGDHLAGEHFFDRLDALRSKATARLQALQVFHLCLLLGFRGKYALDAADRLAYLTARLGDEIAHIQGKSKGFAPRAERPDQVAHRLRSSAPAWAAGALFLVLALCVYSGLRASLGSSTQEALAGYADLVKMPPRAASFSVTLP